MKNSVTRLPGFPSRLKAARENASMTQQAVADELGVIARSYQRYERGESEPSLFTLASLAVILDVTADYLLGLSDEARAD